MSEQTDVIVIGSGIGGLTAALTCARAGRSVRVLEAGKQFGGFTNPFARKHYPFDPGIHYIGQLGPGGRLREIYEGLGVANDLTFLELDPDGYDRVFIGDDRQDIQSGKSAGTRTCAVTYGLGEKAALENESPDFMISELAELAQLFA